MTGKGLIRASTLITSVSTIEQCGGSFRRVFERSNLPIALLEHGDMPIPITDVFNFMREACWETGEAMFGALEAANANNRELGPWGEFILSADTLAGAILRDSTTLPMFATRSASQLRLIGDKAHYSFEFKDSGKEGRLQSEVSAIGYHLDLMREYLGQDLPSAVVHIPYFGRSEISRLEQIFGVPFCRTNGLSRVVFDACLLATPANPGRLTGSGFQAAGDLYEGTQMPDNPAGSMEAIVSLMLLEGNPKIGDVARRMGMSIRTAQRMLKGENTSYSAMLATLKARRSVALMDRGMPLANVASSLGYSDPAHFSRAFSRWAGMPPGKFMTYSQELQVR